MDPSGEGIKKDIPVEKQTIETIGTSLKRITDKKIEQYFRVGEKNSGMTLKLLNSSDRPWRHTQSGEIHLGQEIILEEKEDILVDDRLETRTTVTPYFWDTSESAPRLLIDADGTDGYTGFIDAAYLRRVTTRARKPFHEKWKPQLKIRHKNY